MRSRNFRGRGGLALLARGWACLHANRWLRRRSCERDKIIPVDRSRIFVKLFLKPLAACLTGGFSTDNRAFLRIDEGSDHGATGLNTHTLGTYRVSVLRYQQTSILFDPRSLPLCQNSVALNNWPALLLMAFTASLTDCRYRFVSSGDIISTVHSAFKFLGVGICGGRPISP